MTEPIAHGYDWAWAQISGTNVKSNGGKFAVRYLGGSARLTPQERDNLLADGVAISLVMEQEADQAEKGYTRGRESAAQANREADALGAPADMVLWYADDKNDPSTEEETAFMQGVKSIPGRLSDMYSGGNVLAALRDAGLSPYGGWMVETWYPHAGADPAMIQLANTRDPAMLGVDPALYDTNLLLRPVPMWGGTFIAPSSKEDDMPKLWQSPSSIILVDGLNVVGLAPGDLAVVSALYGAPESHTDEEVSKLLDLSTRLQSEGQIRLDPAVIAYEVAKALQKPEGAAPLTAAETEAAVRRVLALTIGTYAKGKFVLKPGS